MNMENQNNKKMSTETKVALIALKISGIVLACLLALALLFVGIFYLVFSTMYNNGIYDKTVENVAAEQEEFALPDWNELDPVLVGVRVKKETTEYNVMKNTPAKEEYTADLTVTAIYFIDGKLVEKTVEPTNIWVQDGMLSTVGEKKLHVRFADGYADHPLDAYKTVSIPIKVVDDGSAKENSPVEITEEAYTYRGNDGDALWSSMYPEEYELIKSMNIAPIVEIPQKDSDIINVLILGTAENEKEPDLQRKKLETIMIASYNVKTKNVNLISVHKMLLGVYDEKVYPLSGVYAIGGAGAAVNSVNAVLGTDIQHYVEIDLESFVSFVSKMGGVSVNVTEKEIEELMLEDVVPGEATLTGDNVEKYLTDNGADNAGITKTERQRKFLEGLLKKLLNMDSINAFKTVATDTKFVRTNLPFSTVLKYVLRTGLGLSELSFNRHFAPYGEYGKDYAYVIYEEKYKVYYANSEMLKEKTEEIMGYLTKDGEN